MNTALAQYPLPGPKPKRAVRLSRASSRQSPRARDGRYATQLDALVNAHKPRTQVGRSL